MDRLVWIALGGALGTLARYGVTVWVHGRLGAGFPAGTLLVNLVGSFLLGALVQGAATSELVSPTLRLALGVGVLGGFTTYSSFSHETFRFLEEGAWATGLGYAFATLAGCLVATFLGVLAAKRLLAGA